MNKPKTKKEALAKLEKASSELEELKAYIDTMPDDVERDLTHIGITDNCFFLTESNSICDLSGVHFDSLGLTFPQRLSTRSRAHLKQMKKYRDATSRFMDKCHEVNLEDADEKYHEVYFALSTNEWKYGRYIVTFYNPLVITVSKEGAKKLIEWCNREYPNGLNWREL